MKLITVIPVAIGLGFAAITPASAGSGTSVVGAATLHDGTKVTLQAQEPGTGTLIVSSEASDLLARITVDCLEVVSGSDLYSWLGAGPENTLYVSGSTSDGARYYLSAINYNPPWAPDAAAVRAEPRNGPCGADVRGLHPVLDGGFTSLRQL